MDDKVNSKLVYMVKFYLVAEKVKVSGLIRKHHS